MKLSRYGILSAKLDKSGVNGNPILTDEELKELIDITEELVNVATDVNDSPLKFYFILQLQSLDSINRHRNE